VPSLSLPNKTNGAGGPPFRPVLAKDGDEFNQAAHVHVFARVLPERPYRCRFESAAQQDGGSKERCLCAALRAVTQVLYPSSMAILPQDPAEELGKTLELVIELLRRAKSHLSVGRGIERMLMAEPVVLNAAPTFWTLTIYAHIDAAMLLAFKLFDTQPRAVGVLQLLVLTEKNPALFKNRTAAQVSAIVNIARNQIAGINDSLQAINARRNRVIAHLESTAVRDPQKLEAETAVTFSDLNKVFTFAADILNEVSVALRDISPMFDAIGINDFEVIGQLIVEAKCERIKKYEAEFHLSWDGPRPKSCSP
jgi:hypothetical protein